jgi:hypothetical protein
MQTRALFIVFCNNERLGPFAGLLFSGIAYLPPGDLASL